MNPDSTALSSDALLAQMEWVRELARRLVQDQADADDVAQEVWVAAVERPPAVSSDLRSWLAVVTRRVVQSMGRSSSRRQRRETQAARAEAAPDHSDVLARGETCQRLVAAVMALDEPYRSTVLHRYLDGLSTKQIATLDRVTELVVRKRLSRAMHQLRARLDEEFEGGRGDWMAAFAGLRHPASSALAVGVGLGGLLLMKKALVLVVVAIVLALVWFKSPVQEWLGKNQDNHTPAQPLVAGSPSGRATLDAPHATENVRQSVPPDRAASSPTFAVDGIVVNLPAPGTSAEPLPAADFEVSLGDFPRMQTRAVTRTGADGRFHIEIASTGSKLAQVGAAGDETYRGASKTVKLEDNAGLHNCRLERAPHGDIYGIVVSEDGRPLAGVSVLLDAAHPYDPIIDGPERDSGTTASTQNDSFYAKDKERTAITDSAGAFRFSTVHGPIAFMGGHELVAVMEECACFPSARSNH
jgi:RNA polymerase sigma factor (sigma-70 family)